MNVCITTLPVQVQAQRAWVETAGQGHDESWWLFTPQVQDWTVVPNGW